MKSGEKLIIRYQFGQKITTDDFVLIIDKTDHFDPDFQGRYFFRINSKEYLSSYLASNLSVVPENLNAKTIKISLMDFNKFKARDFVRIIDDLYLLSSTEKKNQTISQKIDFLDEQIQGTEEKIRGFDEYFENFTIENKTISLQNDLSKTIGYLNALDSQRIQAQENLSAIEIVLDQLEKDDHVMINPFLAERLPDFISDAIKS